MNAAHLHLMANHFPLVGFVFSFLLLVLGLIRSNEGYSRAGFLVILVAGLFAVPTFLTGEPAEEIIEKLPRFSEQLVEAHEQAAELAIWLIGVTTFAAAAAFWSSLRKVGRSKLLLKVILALNLVSLILIGRTNQLGGQISHPEIRSDSAPGEDEAPPQ